MDDATVTTALGFLSLPPEVRNQVYGYLFKDATLGVSTIHMTGPSCSRTFCRCGFPVALSLTCRLLRQETLHLLLSATTLEVTSGVDKTHLLPDQFLNTIPRATLLDAKVFGSPARLSLARFRGLEVLELRNVSIWCKYYDEEFLESTDADECMFNLAMFNLRRISPALIDLCNAKERSFKIHLGCQFVGNSIRHETVVSRLVSISFSKRSSS